MRQIDVHKIADEAPFNRFHGKVFDYLYTGDVTLYGASGKDLFFVHSDNRSSALVPYSIRLMQHDAEGRLRPVAQDVPFELTLCA